MPVDEKKKDNIEVRILTPDDIELRVVEGDTPKITGYAAKYGKRSANLGGFTEKIRPGAFDEALKDSDVRALKNHDANLLLGRTTSGTLRLDSNSVGLKFEVDMPNTTTGKDVVEEIRRGDITGCSFAFTVAEDEWRNLEEDVAERTIVRVKEVFDVGPVTYPAYPDTSVAARALDTNKQELHKKDEITDDQKAEARARKASIEKGYKHACRIINRIKSADV